MIKITVSCDYCGKEKSFNGLSFSSDKHSSDNVRLFVFSSMNIVLENWNFRKSIEVYCSETCDLEGAEDK